MKKIIYKRLYLISILIATMLNLPFWGMAQSVSIQEAELVALRFANKDSKGGAKQVKKIEKVSMHGVAFLYLAHLNDGWVLLSSERAATPILAESVTGTFPVEDEMPDGMKWLLSYYEAAMQYARDSILDGRENPEWQYLLSAENDTSRLSITTARSEHILPRMLEVKWNQSRNNSGSCNKPYNYYCPTWVQPSCYHAYVGCTAVAMGQVMWYYQWPHSAIVPACMNDSNGNVCSSVRLAEYDWNLMPAAIYNSTSWENVYALSGFLRDCGYASHMKYRANGSGASLDSAKVAMENRFHYLDISHNKRKKYIGSWTNKLKSEIDAGRPVIYAGYGPNGGHAFVIYGYTDNNMFKINWGYSGTGNYGEYSLDALTPDTIYNGPFNNNQEALWGIYPDYPECGSQTLSSSDISTSPFEVYGKEYVSGVGQTITPSKTGVIYAGQMIQLLPPFTIQNGANIHLAIKEMHCDLSDLDIQSGLLIDENDTIAGDVPERYNLPAYIELQQTEEEPLSETDDSTPYNILGQPVDDTYHGIVIRNGQKVLQ